MTAVVTQPQTDLVIPLPPEARSASTARQFVRLHLVTHACDAYLENAELVVTELVTNAIEATRAEVWLEVNTDGGRPVIAVWDQSPVVPEMTTGGGLEDETGRGLMITDALSEKWGCKPDPESGGKIVFAILKDPALEESEVRT